MNKKEEILPTNWALWWNILFPPCLGCIARQYFNILEFEFLAARLKKSILKPVLSVKAAVKQRGPDKSIPHVY